MYAFDNQLTIVTSEATNSVVVDTLTDYLTTDGWAKLTIRRFGMSINNLSGSSVTLGQDPLVYSDNGLFTMEQPLYLGINRAVHDVAGDAVMTGTGLCDVCVEWVTE